MAAARGRKKTKARTILGSVPAPTTSGQGESTVEVRKIANGFIVRETTSGPRSFKTKETFTAEKPQIAISKT